MCLPTLPLFFQHWCLLFISILTENGAHQQCKFQIRERVLNVTVILKGGDKGTICTANSNFIASRILIRIRNFELT